MTECAECLKALSTASLDDVRPGTDIALHATTCYSCAAALQEITFAERRLEESLAEVRPSQYALDVARTAAVRAEHGRRRRLARVLRGVLALASFGVVAIFIETRARPALDAPPEIITETIRLTCLTPALASELASPYLLSERSAVFRSEQLRTVTIRGMPDEFAAARRAIERFETPGECTIPSTDASPVVAPDAGGPGSGAAKPKDEGSGRD